MKSRVPLLILAGAAGLFIMSVAAAQTSPAPSPQPPPFAEPPYKNLKILPQDISRADLIANMKFFSQSLGVRCTHCHVGVEGQPLSTFDFASDAKDKKLFARKMMAMVHRINRQDFGIADLGKAKVTCYTCHRGGTEPLTAPPPAETPSAPPPPSATAPATERG